MNASERRHGRRRFLAGAAGLGLSAAGLALLPGCQNAATGPAALRGELETTRIRVVQTPVMCMAPQYVAGDLLRREGFAEVEYVKTSGPSGNAAAVASGQADISMHFAANVVVQIEAGDPVVILSGVHVGCFELFGTDRIRAIRDLKGRTVATPEVGSGPYLYLATLLAHVGLDPQSDVTWAVHEPAEAIQSLADGRIDAYLGFPPHPQHLRARGVGHVVVNSLVDRPWSQYYCCMVIAHREFVRRNPVATTRALRAILNAVDQAGRDPEGSVRAMVAQGFATQYSETLETVKTIHAGGWRGEYDPEDTLRYYSLRLREAGLIKSSPDKIIDRGTDWRFLAEVRRERSAAASAPFFCPIHQAGASPGSSEA